MPFNGIDISLIRLTRFATLILCHEQSRFRIYEEKVADYYYKIRVAVAYTPKHLDVRE